MATLLETNTKESLCQLCLSIGRDLVNIIGEYYRTYQLITGQNDMNDIKLMVCWECRANLRKIQHFQTQVENANQALISGQLNQTLSSFTLTTPQVISYADSGSTFLNETPIFTDDKPFNIIVDCMRPKNEAKLCITKVFVECENIEEPKIVVKSEDPDELNDNITDEVFDEPDDKNASFDDSDGLPDSNWEPEIPKKKHKEIKKKNDSTKKKYPKKKYTYTPAVKKYKKVANDVVNSEEYLIKLKYDGALANIKNTNLRFKCESCDIYFEQKWSLTVHNKYHDLGQNMYTCSLCKRTFTAKRNLSQHIKRHNYIYVCKLCNSSFPFPGSWKKHIETRHAHSYECQDCGVRFESSEDVNEHIKQLHEKFECEHCGALRRRKRSLEKHMLIAHAQVYKCEDCNKTFQTYKRLYKHRSYNHAKLEQPMYCVECDLNFYNRQKYMMHCFHKHKYANKGKPQSVQCPDCGKVFHSKFYLIDHYDFEHLKKIKYHCEKCNKVFRRNDDLKKHINKVHLGILPPKDKICNICGRGFTVRKTLTHHMRTHTGERPFACECGAAFAQKSALNTHRKTHHKDNALNAR